MLIAAFTLSTASVTALINLGFIAFCLHTPAMHVLHISNPYCAKMLPPTSVCECCKQVAHIELLHTKHI